MKAVILPIAAIVCLCTTSEAQAHGAIDERVLALTEAIAAQPSNAALYLQRGELQRAQRSWSAALRDYDRAARVNPSLDVVDLCRGLLLLEAGLPRAAMTPLDRFLMRNPDHARGRVTRARALVKLGKRGAAIEDFSQAIAHAPQAPPEYYLERAAALAENGESTRAISGLDEGLRRLGNIITLQELAVELEVRAGMFDQALARLERATTSIARRESWLVQRGDILTRAGRTAEAYDVYTRSLGAIAALRPQQRQVRAMRELETRAHAGLATSIALTHVMK